MKHCVDYGRIFYRRYGIMHLTWIWLGITIFAIFAELTTAALVSVWFVGGGLVATILSLIPGIDWYWQLTAFFVVSALMMVFLRPIVKKVLDKNSEGKTNLDNIIGQKVRMLSTADFDKLGSAKINDVVWNIKSADDSVLNEGDIVEIVEISGNKLIAKK